MNSDVVLAPTNGEPSVWSPREPLADLVVQILADQNLTGTGRCLDAGRGVDGVADSREVHHSVNADVADIGGTSVDRRPDGEDALTRDGRHELYGG
jgi:hypothetical protein